MPKPIFEKVLYERLGKKKKVSQEPYSLYKLKDNFQEDPEPEHLDPLIVNREKEIRELIDLPLSTSAGNVSNVAIVGPAGIGKSMIVGYFMYNLPIYAKSGEAKSIFRNLKSFSLVFSPVLSPLLEKEIKKEEKGYSLIAIDEPHFSLVKKESIQSMISIFERGRGKTSFIACWRPRDIIYIRDFHQKLYSYFDKWIYMEPLADDEIKQLLANRLKFFEKEQRKNEYWPFTTDSIELIVRYSRGIPRTALILTWRAIEVAAKSTAPEVGPEYVERAAKEVGLDLVNTGIEKFLEGKSPALEKVLYALLTCEPATTSEVAKMASLDRSTVSQYLNQLHEYKLVEKHQVTKKHVAYTVTGLVSDNLELKIMEEFMEQRRPFRY